MPGLGFDRFDTRLVLWPFCLLALSLIKNIRCCLPCEDNFPRLLVLAGETRDNLVTAAVLSSARLDLWSARIVDESSLRPQQDSLRSFLERSILYQVPHEGSWLDVRHVPDNVEVMFEQSFVESFLCNAGDVDEGREDDKEDNKTYGTLHVSR